MKFLRRISTRRLIVLCGLTAVALIAVAAVAMGMGGSGPKPEPKPLAQAIEDAVNAPQVPGISARIHFTNHLVSAGSVEGADPLLTGADGRLWASPANGGELRLELQSEGGGGDSQVLVVGRRFEVYDGNSETVYRGTLPEEQGRDPNRHESPPSLREIEKGLADAGRHADLSGAIPSDVAGRATYTLEVSPKHDAGLLGAAALAWDAESGVPLRAAIYAKDAGSPVLQLEATDVAFEAVDSSVFEISPPPGAKVVELSPPGENGEGKAPRELAGAGTVERALDFPLAAPGSLAGLDRSAVRGIEVDGKSAALVTYGEGLGGIAVVESAAEPGHEGWGAEGSSSAAGGLTLPRVSIGGVEGEVLETALGTAVRFSRGGVDYLVLGSHPAATVEAAARAL